MEAEGSDMAAVITFAPRLHFHLPDSLPRSYFLGHHAAGLAKMRTMLSQIDLIIECRDYRIPFTSHNPTFESSLAGRERLVVYTKSDLGRKCWQSDRLRIRRPSEMEKGLIKHDAKIQNRLVEWHHPAPVLFSDHKNRDDMRSIMHFLKNNRDRAGPTGSRLMVVGMPNVGKSSLINALRQNGVNKSKAARTGAAPGITRKIGTAVKIFEADDHGNGNIYLQDTPGVFMPYVPDAEAMLKLSLCGCVKDTIVPPFTLADYLLFHVNRQSPDLYAKYSKPTNDVTELLSTIARQTGRLAKGGQPDVDATAMWIIQRWRKGDFGRFFLDDLSDSSLEQFRTALPENSLNQVRRLGKAALRRQAKAKAEAQK